ncbi:hypothetical protein AB6N23_13925, partial [Cellulomonas sp. 179-A 9B4 NHS]
MRISLHGTSPGSTSPGGTSPDGTETSATPLRGGTAGWPRTAADDGPDALVDPGLPAGDLRRHLALLTGDARWAAGATRLHVGPTLLDDTHPAGVPPLVPGARAGLRALPDDPVAGAELAGGHVAVVAGPDAGHVHGLPVGGRLVVTGVVTGVRAAVLVRDTVRRKDAVRGDEAVRGEDAVRGDAATPVGPAALVRDAALVGVRVEVRRSRRGVRVRVRGGAGVLLRPRRGTSRWGPDGGPRPWLPAGRARVVPAAGPAVRRRRVGRLPRRWRPADALHVGGTVLRLRTDAPAARTPLPAPSPWVWSALASAGAGVALAVALRQPLLLVGAAVGLAGLVAARAPAAARTGARAPGPADDPAGTAPPPADVAAVRARAARAARTGEALGT